MKQFLSNEKDKFIQSDEYKAFCEKKCAAKKIKIWDRLKAAIKAEILKQVENFTRALMDELLKLIAPFLALYDAALGIWAMILQLKWQDVLDYLGITALEEEVKAKIIMLVKLYEKLFGECDCDVDGNSIAGGVAGDLVGGALGGATGGVTGALDPTAATTPGANASTSAVKAIQGLATLNPALIATTQPDFSIGFNKAGTGATETLQKAEYAKSESISTAAQYATLAAESLATYDLVTMRHAAKYIKLMHPAIKARAMTQPLMMSMSEYTASWIYCYDPDKPQLGIADWGEKCVATRACYELKLNPDALRMTRNLYNKTNKMLYEGLSKEYKDSAGNVSQYLYLGFAHDIHLAGDVLFRVFHTLDGTVGKTWATTAVNLILGETEYLLNYKNPVINKVVINSSPVMVEAAGSMVKVDKRLNMITQEFKYLDDKGLKD